MYLGPLFRFVLLLKNVICFICCRSNKYLVKFIRFEIVQSYSYDSGLFRVTRNLILWQFSSDGPARSEWC